MNSPAVDVLMVDDAAEDTELAERELRKAGIEFSSRRVRKISS